MEERADEEAASESPKLILNLQGTPVETGMGTVYVKSISFKDLKALNSFLTKEASADTDRQFGREVLKNQTSREADPERRTRLTEAELDALADPDQRRLAEAIAKANGVAELPVGDTAEILGRALREAIRENSKRFADMLPTIGKAFEDRFNWMGSVTRDALKGRLSEISTLGSQLEKVISSSATAGYKLPTFGEQFARRTGVGGIDNMDRKPRRDLQEIHALAVPDLKLPNIEDGPIGRAARAGEESAQQLREVVPLIGQMVKSLGDLSTMLVVDALPEWQAKLAEDRQAGQHSLKQANQSLSWTKWAVMASVVVSVLVTAWQLWVARDNRLEADRQQVEQQARAEALQAAQLQAIRDLKAQVAEQASALRAFAEAQSASKPATGTSGEKPAARKEGGSEVGR